jgi:hypothetical protein
MTETSARNAAGADLVTRWMLVAVSVAAAGLPVTWGVVVGLDALFDLESSFMNAIGLVAVWVVIGATIAAGSLIGIALVGAPRRRAMVMIAATLGALAAATPLSVAMFFRFRYPGCVGLNFFGVPWPEPLQSIAQVLTCVIVASTVVVTVACFVIRGLRWVAVTVVGWLTLAAIPTAFVFVLSVYGDPGPGCIVP